MQNVIHINDLQGWRVLGTTVARTWPTGSSERGSYNSHTAVQRSSQHCWTWVSTCNSL